MYLWHLSGSVLSVPESVVGGVHCEVERFLRLRESDGLCVAYIEMYIYPCVYIVCIYIYISICFRSRESAHKFAVRTAWRFGAFHRHVWWSSLQLRRRWLDATTWRSIAIFWGLPGLWRARRGPFLSWGQCRAHLRGARIGWEDLLNAVLGLGRFWKHGWGDACLRDRERVWAKTVKTPGSRRMDFDAGILIKIAKTYCNSEVKCLLTIPYFREVSQNSFSQSVSQSVS